MKLPVFKKVFTLASLAAMFLSLYYEDQSTAYQAVPDEQLIQTDSIITQKTTVSIIQSDKPDAGQITYDEIKSMISQAVSLAGGFDTLIHDGDRVILKPNLVASRDYSWNSQPLPAEVNGITTDWRVVKAVSELVRERNPHGKIYIMEGSGADKTFRIMPALKYYKFNFPAVDSLIYLENTAAWEDYSSPNLATVVLPASKALYPDNLKPNRTKEFYLNRLYKEAEVLISIPVLKNHEYTGVTGAIKNVGIGGTPANIYGSGAQSSSRQDLNRIDHRADNNMDNLHRWIHDYYLCRPVDYVIMDGLQGSQNGPVAGGSMGARNLKECQKNMRLIIAGKNALSVDAIEALIIGNDPAKVNHLNYLSKDSVGYINPAYIKIAGKKVHEVKKKFIFGAWTPGSVSQYSDFTAPVCTLNSCRTDGQKLYVSVSGNEIFMSGISYNGNMLDQVAVSKFSNMVFNTGIDNPDISKIRIYVYDKYLNCTELNPGATDVRQKQVQKKGFGLMQNYPNPFNPATKINYSIGEDCNADLSVFDVNGKKVCTLFNGYSRSGEHTVNFDGRHLCSGIYYYTLSAGKYRETKKLILLK
ncbi:MAG: DUF362 domain-containing protein [Bacteroidota bacterium]